MKNIIIIVIDALSKWYIDQHKNENSFFKYLEKEGYCADNMYSTGPFTEAAVRGFWTADDALRGKNYLVEDDFRKKTMYQTFRDLKYYIYLGELIPFINNNIYSDNLILREALGARGFEHIWRGRLVFYISLYKENKLKETDFWKIRYLLDKYFENFSGVFYVDNEYLKYRKDNKKYIFDILSNEEASSFFQNQDHTMYDLCKYKNIEDFKNQCTHIISKEELEFIYLVKEKNTKFLMEMNRKFNCEDFIENELNGSRSRCVHSNENILSHMRDESEKLPKLKEELDKFIDWYDNEGFKLDVPYWAYIHNYDFHYPENFMNTRYEENQFNYIEEIKKKIRQIESLECSKMSVSKQLTLLNIEECLAKFLNELKQRKIDKNTILIITSDHGISNFMYPIDKKNERWNYTKTNFQVPFYMCGCGINKYKDNKLHSSKEILPTLLYICKNDVNFKHDLIGENKEYITVSWINGVPDYDYQKIKFGIRTNEYSITYESFLSQFYSHDNIIGLYNLLNDPDECNNLYYKNIKDPVFKKLMKRLPDLWFDEILNIILSDEMGYGLKEKYSFLLEKTEYFRRLNRKAEYIPIDQFKDIMREKKIILVGSKKGVSEFLMTYNSSYIIQELWLDKSEEKYFMGHNVKQNWSGNPDIPIMVTSDNEMEIVNDLREKNCTCCFIQRRKYCI